MEKSATLNLRINPALKQNAENVLSRLGIPMSTAVDMFLNQVVLVGGIPFPVTIPNAPERRLFRSLHPAAAAWAICYIIEREWIILRLGFR